MFFGRMKKKSGRSCLVALIICFCCFVAQGQVWTLRNPLPTNESMQGVAYGNGKFVSVGTGGAILTSLDGVTWARQNSGTLSNLSCATWGNNKFVAVGSAGIILISSDGVSWATKSSGTIRKLNAVTW